MNGKRVMICLMLLFLWGAVCSEHLRAEDDLGMVLKNGLYGGVIGTLIGGAVLLLINDPDDHLEILGYGAGSGILLGTVYGISQLPRRSMVEVDQGKVSWNIPNMILTGEFQRTHPFMYAGSKKMFRKKVEIGIVKVLF